MSSKKIPTSFTLSPEVLEKFDAEAFREVGKGKRSFWLEKMLRERYALPWGQETRKEIKHAI